MSMNSGLLNPIINHYTAFNYRFTDSLDVFQKKSGQSASKNMKNHLQFISIKNIIGVPVVAQWK